MVDMWKWRKLGFPRGCWKSFPTGMLEMRRVQGYGFVELSDGSGDAFLHVTALAGIGVSTLQPGETLELHVALGQRGPQVTEVISVR